jgi:plastocyanin
LTARAGAITIQFENDDPNVTHNVAVFRDASDTSTPLGATPITSGPDEQTLNITLDKGEYYFQCQVHPDMNGKLVVR